MIKLNRTSVDLLDNIPLTKNDRLIMERDYNLIISSIQESITTLRSKNDYLSNGNVAEHLFSILYKKNKSLVVKTKKSVGVYVENKNEEPEYVDEAYYGKNFTFAVLKHLGYDHEDRAVFKRHFKNVFTFATRENLSVSEYLKTKGLK